MIGISKIHILTPIQLLTSQEERMNSSFDPKTMLAIFDFFLKDPKLLYDKPNENWRKTILALPLHRDWVFDDNSLRWHIAVFLDEYVLSKDVVNAVFGSLNLQYTEDYLNRSGKQLLADLRYQRYCTH